MQFGFKDWWSVWKIITCIVAPKQISIKNDLLACTFSSYLIYTQTHIHLCVYQGIICILCGYKSVYFVGINPVRLYIKVCMSWQHFRSIKGFLHAYHMCIYIYIYIYIQKYEYTCILIFMWVGLKVHLMVSYLLLLTFWPMVF